MNTVPVVDDVVEQLLQSISGYVAVWIIHDVFLDLRKHNPHVLGC